MCFRHRGTGQSGQIVPGSPSPVLHDGEKQQILVPLFSPGRRTLILPLVAGVQAAARNDERGAASQRWRESQPDCLSAKVTSQRRQNRMDVP